MNIKKSIKLAMAYRDINQKQLAEKAGIGVVTVSHIIHGKTKASAEILNKIAKATDYTMSEFIALGE